ncbi:hypothetical protein AVEN_129246-1, partial [Araneus ventricosus]
LALHSGRIITLEYNKGIEETYHQLPALEVTDTVESEIRLGLPSAAVVGDRFGVSDRAVATIASSVLHDVGFITSNNSDLVVDNNKLRREKA